MGVRMILPISTATAQNLLTALQWADDHGLSPEHLRTLLQELVAGCQPPPVVEKHRRRLTVCPSCGVGVLLPVVNGDGLRILGCHLCRYSSIVEVR